MKLIEFDDAELNCLNVCLDHFIDEQTEADFEVKFTSQLKQELHKGDGWGELEMFSAQLENLSTAVRALSKIRYHNEKEKQHEN